MVTAGVHHRRRRGAAAKARDDDKIAKYGANSGVDTFTPLSMETFGASDARR